MAIKNNTIWTIPDTGITMSGSYSNIHNIEWSKGRSIDHSSTNYVVVRVRHYATSQSRVDGLRPAFIQRYEFNVNMTGSLDSSGFFGQIYDNLKLHTDGPFSGSSVEDV